MSKIVLTRWFSVLLAAGSVAPVFAASGQSIEKSLTPQHEMALKNEIQTCAERVLSASSVDERVRCQEALCTKLVQAQDYENALKAATAIYSTAGADPKRRAAHHFMIAYIYNLRMSKSATVEEGEEYRQRAIAVAREVLAANYPASYGVSVDATKLISKLQDRRHLAQVQSDLVKNQSGGVAPNMMDIAKRQSQAMAASVSNARQSGYATPGRGGSGGSSNSVKGYFSRGGAAYTQASAPRSGQTLMQRIGATNPGSYGTYSTTSGQGTGTVSYSRAQNYGSYGTIANSSTPSQSMAPVRSSGKLSSPVIIDGANRQVLAQYSTGQ